MKETEAEEIVRKLVQSKGFDGNTLDVYDRIMLGAYPSDGSSKGHMLGIMRNNDKNDIYTFEINLKNYAHPFSSYISFVLANSKKYKPILFRYDNIVSLLPLCPKTEDELRIMVDLECNGIEDSI